MPEDSPYEHSRVFLIAANACLSSGNGDDCISKVNLDLLADRRYKDLGSPASTYRIRGSLDASRWGPEPHKANALIYIYCAPCRHQIEVALNICGNMSTFHGIIRVDNRLASSCCHGTPLFQKFNSLRTAMNDRNWVTGHCDIPWFEQRFIEMEAEQEDDGLSMGTYFQIHKDDARCVAMIIISDSFGCARLASVAPLVPPTRPARAGEIYVLHKIQVDQEESPKVRWKPTFFTRIV